MLQPRLQGVTMTQPQRYVRHIDGYALRCVPSSEKPSYHPNVLTRVVGHGREEFDGLARMARELTSAAQGLRPNAQGDLLDTDLPVQVRGFDAKSHDAMRAAIRYLEANDWKKISAVNRSQVNTVIQAATGQTLLRLATSWEDMMCIAVGWLEAGADPAHVLEALARYERASGLPIYATQVLAMNVPRDLAQHRAEMAADDARRGVTPGAREVAERMVYLALDDDALVEGLLIQGVAPEDVPLLVRRTAQEVTAEQARDVRATYPGSEGLDEIVPDDDTDLVVHLDDGTITYL